MKQRIVKLALILVGLLATPAVADCLDEQRQWQREENQWYNSVTSYSYDAHGSLDRVTGKSSSCTASDRLYVMMLKHKAAFYRHCHPDLDGEEKAHDADRRRIALEGICN